MEFTQLGKVTGHPSGEVQNVLVARDKYDQAQVVLSEDDGDMDTTSYVCTNIDWDMPNVTVLAGLKKFPGFESLEWAS